MKKMICKIAGIICCSGILFTCAAEFTPAVSWSAKPGDTIMTYTVKGKIEGRYIDDKRAVYQVFNQDKKAEVGAYFSDYRCRFKAELPSSLWKQKGNLTILGKFCLSNVEKSDPKRSPIIFRIQNILLNVNRSGNAGAKGQLSFNVNGSSSKGGSKGGHRYIDSGFRVDNGRWHTFGVCISGNQMMMWVDGKKIAITKTLNAQSNPLPFNDFVQIGGEAKGLWISNIRFYNYALPENFIAKEGKPILNEKAPIFKEAAPKLNNTVSKILTEKITLAAGVKPKAELLQVKAISGRMRLPFRRPYDAEKTKVLRMVATPGEYEPVSFVIHAQTNLPQTTIKASDLKSKDGTINAGNIDIKLVKCWYQGGTAWVDIGNIQNVSVLTPELMLNDDSLVKVDYELKRNYIKINNKYIEMTSRTTEGQPGMNNDQFPVKDSPELLPFSVKENIYKQVWVTVHVPKNSKAGIYTGKIQLSSNGVSIGHFDIKLRVLPFSLAKPKTFYNPEKIFTSSIYYKGILADKGTLTGWNKNEEQYRADMRNMLAHGVTSPMLHELEVKKDFKDFERAIRIRKEMGISIDPLYLLGKERNLGYEDTTDPAKIARAVAYFKQIQAITNKYDIKTVYVYGLDEAVGAKLTNQKTIWKALREAGAKIYTSGFMHRTPEAYKLGGYLDVFVNYGKPYKKWAQQWHSKNAMIWSYANPQGGIENPLAYRRGFGFPLWMANYDGAATYVYNHGYGHTWNDFDNNRYRDHNLTYPTINGVIDTIAWEGYREAMDDIRYGTTLQEYIAKAKKSKNPQKINIAQAAEKWLNTIYDNEHNLDTIRLQIIKWTLKLL